MLDVEEKALINKMSEHITCLRNELAENTRKTDRILEGFPDGDPDGHRRYHEEIIQQMADRRTLRRELLLHLLKGSSWSALLGALFVLWKYFKSQLNA